MGVGSPFSGGDIKEVKVALAIGGLKCHGGGMPGGDFFSIPILTIEIVSRPSDDGKQHHREQDDFLTALEDGFHAP